MWETIRRLAEDAGVHMQYCDLSGARAVVDKTLSGYIVLVDPRYDEAVQQRAIMHELLHIYLGHLDHRSYLLEEIKEAEVISIAGR